jgi:hypothetical protein
MLARLKMGARLLDVQLEVEDVACHSSIDEENILVWAEMLLLILDSRVSSGH